MSSTNNKGEGTSKGKGPVADNQSGKQKRRERNKSIRQIGATHNKNDNTLATDLPKVTGPIDADRFALARISEINDMQSAIKKASYALTELAFQSLPRGLRRRAASHNIHRLPARLRAKAAREANQSAPNMELVRKKTRKIKRPRNTVQEFLRRQKSKKWLETHMWHTKRMKMNDIWGYRIASRPNTKSVRITYRSFTQLSIVHDASYMGCIELKGDSKEIVKALDMITDAGAPSVGSARYIRGNRFGTTNLYEYLGYPTKLICPISYLWKPNTQDTLWIWIHPSAFNEALIFIKKAIEETSVKLTDLRDEILRFELTGPRSTALLQAILDPVSDSPIEGNKVWRDLGQLRSSCSLSPGSVLGLVVQDPRLKFPQKVPPRTNEISPQDQKTLQETLENWPSDAADTLIWDKEYRKSLFDKKISEYHLNLRREKNLVPGTKLDPTPEDSKIPILLVQRGGGNPLSTYEFAQGWTVILPRGFGLAFWKSLVFAGARVAGYNDVRAMHFESGLPCFPQDYPGTRAFEIQRAMDKKAAQSVWEKRPPAKRVNFEKRGIEHPFECAFETLSSADHMNVENEHNLPARPTYSLVHGEQFVTSLLKDQDYMAKLNTFVSKRGLDAASDVEVDDLLVKIRLKYIGRGKPSKNALIYSLEDQEDYNACTKKIQTKLPTQCKRRFNDLLEDKNNDESFKIPEKSTQIGYITNGDFSLTLGFGFGIGACTVTGLRKLYSIDEQQNRPVKMLVLVRNTTSLEAYPAQIEILY